MLINCLLECQPSAWARDVITIIIRSSKCRCLHTKCCLVHYANVKKNIYFMLYFFVTRSVNQSIHFSVIVAHLSNQIQIYSEIHHTNINTHNCRWVTAVLFIDYKLIPLICFLFSISMYLFVNVVLCVLFWFLCLESPPLSCDLCWSWLYSPVSCSALD